MSAVVRSPLVLSALVLALLLASYFAFTEIRDWRSGVLSRFEISQMERARLNARSRSLEAQLGSLDQQILPFELWSAETEAAANARIQDALVTLADSVGFGFRSLAPTRNVRPDDTNSATFRLEAEVEYGTAVAFLDALETHEPPFLIERAVLRRLSRSEPDQTLPSVLLQIDVAAIIALGGDDDG